MKKILLLFIGVLCTVSTWADSDITLSIETNPTKTTYIAGECFDPTGLEVAVNVGGWTIFKTYSDSQKDFFDFSPSLTTPLTINDNNITVTYHYDNLNINNRIQKDVTAEIPIKVVSACTILTPPTKTTYFPGETFDPTGLKISYSDGESTNEVTYSADTSDEFSFTPSASTALTATDTKVTIAYKVGSDTYMAEQAITINPTSGKCGDDITWMYDKATGALTLTGTGKMYDFNSLSAPWNSYVINTLSIGEGITSIGKWAFYNTDNNTKYMTSVEMPSTMETIGYQSFDGCSSITSLTLNEGLEYIGGWAFRAAKIETLNIPSSVRAIDGNAFYACTELKYLILNNGLDSIGGDAFACNKLADVVVPCTVRYFGGQPFAHSPNGVNITLRSIPEFAQLYDDGQSSIRVVLSDDSYIYSDAAKGKYTSVENDRMTSMTYTRVMSNRWGTIVLPFDVASNDQVEYYGITGIDNDVLTITKYATLPAGTPALVKKLSGSQIEATASGKAINTQPNDITGSVSMKGSYVDNTKVEDANAYYISNNKFYKNNEYFYIDAFRAYFSTSANGAKNSVLTISENLFSVSTAIDALTDASADVKIVSIHDASGALRTELGSGMNILKLSNGKTQKIIVK